MSVWRKEASKQLPELHRLIVSRNVDNPMRLLIDLHSHFHELCATKPLQIDLLKRIWGYVKWCLKKGNDETATAAALGFCEHLLDSQVMKAIPMIMTREDFMELRGILLYHNSEEKYTNGLKHFEK